MFIGGNSNPPTPPKRLGPELNSCSQIQTPLAEVSHYQFLFRYSIFFPFQKKHSRQLIKIQDGTNKINGTQSKRDFIEEPSDVVDADVHFVRQLVQVEHVVGEFVHPGVDLVQLLQHPQTRHLRLLPPRLLKNTIHTLSPLFPHSTCY